MEPAMSVFPHAFDAAKGISYYSGMSRHRILDFCIAQGLLNTQTAEFLEAHFERGGFDPIREVLGSGIREDVLYRTAADFYKVRLLKEGSWQRDPGAELSRELQKYFGVIALRDLESNSPRGPTVYATDDFTRLELLEGALGNILGKEVSVALMPRSLYKACSTDS